MRLKVLIIKLFSLPMLILFVLAPSFAETIVLKSGEKVEAKIMEKTFDYIKVELYGVILTYYLDDILSIDGQPPSFKLKSGPEKSVSQIFKEVSPSVVVINAQLTSGFSQGSGFIAQRNGVVVTNYHVVIGAREIEVKFKDGETYPVVGIIDYDLKKDICVLKIDADNLPVATLGDSNTLNPGDKVLVIGAPLGLEYSITDGLFSGIRRELNLKSLQFSASISRGNSGGPLLNMQGEVIGITTYTKIEGQNLNFAVPINEAKNFIKTYPKISLTEFGKIGKAHYFYNLAYEAHNSGNIESSIEYLQKAIATDPNFYYAYVNLASVYDDLNNSEEAITLSKKAINIDPHKDDAYINLGVGYMLKGIYNEAIQSFKKAITIDPDNPITHDNLGVTYKEIGMLDEAIAEHKKAISLDPYFASAYSNLSAGYIDKKLYQEAIKAATKAISLAPDFANAYYNLALAYKELEEYDLAVKYYSKAQELGHPVDPDFLKSLKIHH